MYFYPYHSPKISVHLDLPRNPQLQCLAIVCMNGGPPEKRCFRSAVFFAHVVDPYLPKRTTANITPTWGQPPPASHSIHSAWLATRHLPVALSPSGLSQKMVQFDGGHSQLRIAPAALEVDLTLFVRLSAASSGVVCHVAMWPCGAWSNSIGYLKTIETSIKGRYSTGKTGP